jgi:hypothetical protein
MTKPRPKTGETRKTKLPLKIDRLPQSAQAAIQALYGRGRTWVEIAEHSARPYSAEWEKDGGGFIDWPNVDPDALDLFPGLRLAKSSLQRWFDLRVSQVRAQVMAESARTRVWVESLADKDVAGTNAAVMNAARDQAFNMLQTVAPGDQEKFFERLGQLTLMLSRLQRVDLQAKRVEVDARKLKILEEREKQARERLDQATQQAAKKGTGQFSIDDINLLRERTFGLPPIQVTTNA